MVLKLEWIWYSIDKCIAEIFLNFAQCFIKLQQFMSFQEGFICIFKFYINLFFEFYNFPKKALNFVNILY